MAKQKTPETKAKKTPSSSTNTCKNCGIETPEESCHACGYNEKENARLVKEAQRQNMVDLENSRHSVACNLNATETRKFDLCICGLTAAREADEPQ